MRHGKGIYIAMAWIAVAPMLSAHTITVGTNLFEAVFEDASLEETDKARMATDVSEALCFISNWQNAIHTSGAEVGTLRRNRQTEIYGGTGLVNGLRFIFTNGVNEVVVSKELSDEHLERLAKFQVYDNAMALLRTRISELNSDSFTNLSLQAKMDFFWPAIQVPTNATPEQIRHVENSVIPILRDYIVYPPSIFRLHEGLTIGKTTVPIYAFCPILARPGKEESETSESVGLIDGQWRFNFFPYE